jgi:epsilon-lactone hydrolase
LARIGHRPHIAGLCRHTPLDPEDAAITAATRAMASSAKGAPRGIEARGQFDALMESVLPRDDVTFEADTLGDIPGIWVHPAN